MYSDTDSHSDTFTVILIDDSWVNEC